MRKLNFNTDEIKTIVESIVSTKLPVDAMLRGQSLTIYPERDGWIRILAHRENGVLSWLGYWFHRETRIEELESMLRDSESYLPKKIKACGTHFYYSDVTDQVIFTIGVETLAMGVKSIGFEMILPHVEDAKPVAELKLKPASEILYTALSQEGKEYYRTIHKKIIDTFNDEKSWVRKLNGLYCAVDHDLMNLSMEDAPIYVKLLELEFKNSSDYFTIIQKTITFELSFIDTYP